MPDRVIARSRSAGASRQGLTWRTAVPAFVVHSLMRRPLDSLLVVIGAAAIGGIVVNGTMLQPGPHPAPMFTPASKPASAQAPAEAHTGAVAVPRPRPPDAGPAADTRPARARAELVTEIQRELTRLGYFNGAADGVFGPKIDAAIRDFEQVSGLKPTGEPTDTILKVMQKSQPKASPAAPRPAQGPAPARKDAIADLLVPSRQVIAIQRALSDFGYGQVSPSGVVDAETRAAIERFERAHKMPVTGQLSDRLTRELATMTGRSL